MPKRFAIAVLAMLATLAFGQQPAKLSFDVASIKPSPAQEPGRMFFQPKKGGPGTGHPGRITWNGATLMGLLITAYDVKRYQVNGPEWLNTERFDPVPRTEKSSRAASNHE